MLLLLLDQISDTLNGKIQVNSPLKKYHPSFKTTFSSHNIHIQQYRLYWKFENIAPGLGEENIAPGLGEENITPGLGEENIAPGLGEAHIAPGLGEAYIAPGLGEENICVRVKLVDGTLTIPY
jgi:hypothetical protein